MNATGEDRHEAVLRRYLTNAVHVALGAGCFALEMILSSTGGRHMKKGA